MKPSVSIMNVTPGVAKVWLDEANVKNRRLRQKHVAALVSDLAGGAWRLSPDAVAFDVTGRLINGQHRLTAIVETGIAADCIVLLNAPVDTYDITDDGLKRTLSDRLTRDGHGDVAALAAVVAAVYAWEIAGWPTTSSGLIYPPTKTDYLDRLERDEELFVVANRVGSRTASAVGLPRAWWATAYFMIVTTAGQRVADEFIERIITERSPFGWPLPGDHPCIAIRKTIDRDYRASRPTIRTNRKLALALIVKAFNAFAEDRPVKLLKFRVSGENAEEFPEITTKAVGQR